MFGKRKLNIECQKCPNRDCSLLKYCDATWLSFINEHKACITFKKGQQIIYERMPVCGMYFILSCKAKVHKHVSKHLADFREEGIIDLNTKDIHVKDGERLKVMAGIMPE